MKQQQEVRFREECAKRMKKKTSLLLLALSLISLQNVFIIFFLSASALANFPFKKKNSSM